MTVPGEVLAGRYRLLRRVAAGGLGSVWEAWDELLQRRVAIKELRPPSGLSQDEAAVARGRVIREARITARLHHPHAVTLYDVIDHGCRPCLILQYVPSRTLDAMLDEQGLLPAQFVTGVGAEVASALAAAHQVGIIHRDVNPSSVLITPAGVAVITDFGISDAAGDVSIDGAGIITGATGFLAPEVVRGAPSGFPADVFSLGATLYAALEGTAPCGADQDTIAILRKVASGGVIPPRRSGGLASVLGQMLATEPAARPAMSTVARLLTDLRSQRSAAVPAPHRQTAVVQSRTVRERPSDHEQGSGPASPGITDGAAVTSEPGHGRRRRPLGAMLIGAAVLLLAGVGAWLPVSGSHGSPPTAGKSLVVVAASGVASTSAQRAAAITNYFALLPGNTDQGWAHLTSNFQNGTARNWQEYQRFWGSIQRVTAGDAHGASLDTAEATVTYYFKDGRTSVEATVYSLVVQEGTLKIDSSTVLGSITH